MNITDLTAALQRDAVWVVFANVLLQQLGLPIPAVPTLLLAGSLAMSFGHGGQLLAAAVVASMLADWLWYFAGRAFGYRVLTGLCKLSINPGSCDSSAEALFLRWGAWSLVVAKFVPGFSTVGPPIAGSMRLPLPSFTAAAGLGAALWAGGALLGGWLLRAEIVLAIDGLNKYGATALTVVALLLATWLTWKLWQKHRFERLAAIPHISAADLRHAMGSSTPPLFLDLRGAATFASGGPIAGATHVALEDLPATAGHWPKNALVVTMCACPGDATAVRAAHALAKGGYTNVRPLKGGFDAWMERSADNA